MTKGINQREIKGAVYQNILEGPEHYSTFLCLLVSQIVILSLSVDIFNLNKYFTHFNHFEHNLIEINFIELS